MGKKKKPQKEEACACEHEPVDVSITDSQAYPTSITFHFETKPEAHAFHKLAMKEIGHNGFLIEQMGTKDSLLDRMGVNDRYFFKTKQGEQKVNELYRKMQSSPSLAINTPPKDAYKGHNYSYENQFQVNKAIEALLDSKYNLPFLYDTPDGREIELPENELSGEEKLFISRYAGYGGLEKFGAEGAGLLYEYFTPEEVVKKMWALAFTHGYRSGPVLETSVGTGRFLKYKPQAEPAVGFEINPYSAAVSKILYQDAQIYLKFFEQTFIKNNNTVRGNVQSEKYALVIGNPPYGDFTGKYAGMGEKKYTGATNFVEYFITRGLDLLVPGGLLIYIIGAQLQNGGRLFLSTGKTPAKEAIDAKAELLDAYRLPMGLFETTDVTTEILVFQKR